MQLQDISNRKTESVARSMDISASKPIQNKLAISNANSTEFTNASALSP